MQPLTLDTLKISATQFAKELSIIGIPDLFGVSDGKAVGTYVEVKFKSFLRERYILIEGNAARGIDFPALDVDLKVTSVRQPQSSCPFSSASQKVYGLGYHLLVFVYDKEDERSQQTSYLRLQHVVFVEKAHTADYQTTKAIIDIMARGGNVDDIDAMLEERHLPLDEIGRRELAERIIQNPPNAGFLTISNALQWRLQYGRLIALAQQGNITGLETLL